MDENHPLFAALILMVMIGTTAFAVCSMFDRKSGEHQITLESYLEFDGVDDYLEFPSDDLTIISPEGIDGLTHWWTAEDGWIVVDGKRIPDEPKPDSDHRNYIIALLWLTILGLVLFIRFKLW